MRNHSESGIIGNNEEKDRLKSFIDDLFVIESCIGRAGDGAQAADVADPGRVKENMRMPDRYENGIAAEGVRKSSRMRSKAFLRRSCIL